MLLNSLSFYFNSIGSEFAMVKNKFSEKLENVNIRQFGNGDLSGVRKLFSEGFKSYKGPTSIAGAYFVAQKLKEDMSDIQKYYLDIDGGNFWVAEESEFDFKGGLTKCSSRIVGCVGIQPRFVSDEKTEGGDEKMERRKRIFELVRMFVDETYHGTGLATLLVQTLERFASEDLHCDEIYLSTGSDMMKACKFYEKMGYAKSQLEGIKMKDHFGEEAPDFIHFIQSYRKTFIGQL